MPAVKMESLKGKASDGRVGLAYQFLGGLRAGLGAFYGAVCEKGADAAEGPR